MKAAVLSGSPKGKYSITLQTVLYLQKCFPDCEFEVLHIGQRIKALEKDMSDVLEILSRAELLLFCYPVYTFLAPSQLHRFIELLKASKVSLEGKYAAQISTSKHFYDVTAHAYIKENAQDLGLKYIAGLSADMDDLLETKGQEDAKSFWKYVLYCAQNDIYERPAGFAEKAKKPAYARQFEDGSKSERFDTVILTDCEKDDANLAALTEDFRAVYPYASRVVNIRDYPFSGGCLGCFNCAVTGKCIYKDGFDSFLREKIQTADAMVYAFTIKDHSMGAAFKLYDDRQFCNGHRTVTMGMPIAYIISGDYDSEKNLQTVVEGRAEVGHNFLAGTASDGENAAWELQKLSEKLCYALENKLVLPQNFYGVGGMKIFRDLIYLMRGMMKADHKFYKQHGMYDFPQKKVGTVLKMQLVGALIASPAVKRKMGNKMNEGMIEPYRKVLREK